jgi:hypothetical protein
VGCPRPRAISSLITRSSLLYKFMLKHRLSQTMHRLVPDHALVFTIHNFLLKHGGSSQTTRRLVPDHALAFTIYKFLLKCGGSALTMRLSLQKSRYSNDDRAHLFHFIYICNPEPRDDKTHCVVFSPAPPSPPPLFCRKLTRQWAFFFVEILPVPPRGKSIDMRRLSRLPPQPFP